MLTPATFQQRTNDRFAENEMQNITEATFRTFGDDIRATFVPLAEANVPAYDPKRFYAEGFLVTFNSLYYKAKVQGFLPTPTPGQETDEWLPDFKPLPPLLPYREMAVQQGQDWSSEGSLEPSKLYRLTGRVDATTGDALDDVLVQAVSRHSVAGADAYAIGLDLQTRQEYLLPISYDLLTDTTSPRAAGSGDSYTKTEADELLATKGSASVQAQHSQELATLNARNANLYSHYADNTVAPFDTLDAFLAAAELHGGTYRVETNATVLSISKTNQGHWPAYWDAAGATIVVPTGTSLKSNAEAENLTFGNFYLDGGGSFLLSGLLDQATPAGRASRLFTGISTIPLVNPGNVLLLDGGYYKKITGAGKYYLVGTVQVDDMTEASNVVDLRGGTGSGTVKTINGVAPDEAGNVTLATLDRYGYSAAKRSQVFGLFTTANQVTAVDVALAGDTSTGIGSCIPDLSNGALYELVPDPDNPMPGPNGAVIGTPTWIRTRA